MWIECVFEGINYHAEMSIKFPDFLNEKEARDLLLRSVEKVYKGILVRDNICISNFGPTFSMGFHTKREITGQSDLHALLQHMTLVVRITNDLKELKEGKISFSHDFSPFYGCEIRITKKSIRSTRYF